MYRMIDLLGVFKQSREHVFGGQSCRVKTTITDSFYPANAGSMIVHVKAGKLTVSEENTFKVEIRLDVAEFSSLLLGVVSFRNLCRYHLADILDPHYLETITRLFLVQEKPICLTAF